MKVDGSGVLASNNAVNMDKNRKDVNRTLENIAAQRALKGTDGANLLIADALISEVSLYSQGIKNANDAIGMLQIADGALSSISQNAAKLNELSVAYNNGALNEEQKAAITSEAAKLTATMEQTISTTTYNGKSVFSGELTFQTGKEGVSVNTQAPELGAVDVTNQDSVLGFMSNISKIRSSIGSSINEMQALVNSHLSAITNMTESESKLQNNDIAENYNALNTAKLKEGAALYANSFNYESLQKKLNALLG